MFRVFVFLVFAASFASGQRLSDVVATINARNVTIADLSPETVTAVRDAPTKRVGLRKELADRFIYERVLALEAAALRTTPEQIEAAALASVPNPTAAQIKAVYDANRSRLGDATLEQARRQIVAFLRSPEEQKAINSLASRLLTKYKYTGGKDVNANGLAPADVIATIAAKPVLAKEFDEYARIELHELDASLADQILFDARRTLYAMLVVEEAAAEKIPAADLIAREVTNKIRDYRDDEIAALESALENRLIKKYNAKIAFVPARPLVQSISLDDDPAFGPADAPVKVVMFSDFQCSACKATHPILKKVMSEFEGKIRFVVRDYPLENLHENAFDAALAANAAHAQGKFLPFIELLYANQDALNAASLTRYAEQVGLDLKKFQLDTKAPNNAAEVRRDKADGKAYGINGTPTIYVNGVKIRDISEKGIRTAFSAALDK